jgi:cobaltochelatase CobT
LCALLHIEYQTFEETLSEQDWEVMTHPDLLRENVDGEALEWAVSLITDRPEPHKLIVMLSDGAPVDDATLTHNGPSLLERHLLSVIEAEGKIMLAGLGIGFAVDRYYSRSRSTADLTEMPHALIGLIGDAAKDVHQGRHEL